jgi:gliding motility-associated protein GldM
MSLPREPRQKMINMMYLVLTALLALNVSAEILNAFKTVNNSLETTNKTVNLSTETILKSLEEKKSDPSPATAQKAVVWFDKANQVKSQSANVYDYIHGIKAEILKRAGGDINNKNKKFKEDNLDITTRYMVEKGEGKKLYNKLAEYKKNILSIDPAINVQFANSLQIDLTTPPTSSKGNKTWEAAYFRMVPTVAALTILSKFQNDVKTTENKVVAFCHEQVGKVEYKFDAYVPIVGQSSKYLMPGQELEITAGLGAFSKKNIPNITIGGSNAVPDENGIATFKTPSGGIGAHTIPVVVKFTDQEGVLQTKTYNVEYVVGQANASIALDKMNVLYIGVANPVSVAASGGGDDKIGFSINGAGGRWEKTGAGKYNVFVNSVTDDCKITVSVDGKIAGISQFRTRTIPKPIAIVGPYESGASVAANAFRAQAGVGAGIKDFPFELNYKVTRFEISADDDDGYIKSAACQGNLWNAEAQSILSKLKSGRTITVDEIYAMGPDGRNQKLPSLVYYIK